MSSVPEDRQAPCECYSNALAVTTPIPPFEHPISGDFTCEEWVRFLVEFHDRSISPEETYDRWHGRSLRPPGFAPEAWSRWVNWRESEDFWETFKEMSFGRIELQLAACALVEVHLRAPRDDYLSRFLPEQPEEATSSAPTG